MTTRSFTHADRHELSHRMAIANQQGNFDELTPYKFQGNFCIVAAADGYLDILKWARNNEPPNNTAVAYWDSWVCAYAAEGTENSRLHWAVRGIQHLVE